MFCHWKGQYSWILNDQHLVCIPKDWTCLKTELIGCQGKNGNNVEENLDSTLTRCPKLITNESWWPLCETLKDAASFILYTSQGQAVWIWSGGRIKQPPNEDYPIFLIDLYSSKVSISSKKKEREEWCPIKGD